MAHSPIVLRYELLRRGLWQAFRLHHADTKASFHPSHWEREETVLSSHFLWAESTCSRSLCECASFQSVLVSHRVEVIDYYMKNNASLFVDCKDSRPFSHCQQYFLFRYDTRKEVCEPFYRQNCRSGWEWWTEDTHHRAILNVTKCDPSILTSISRSWLGSLRAFTTIHLLVVALV